MRFYSGALACLLVAACGGEKDAGTGTDEGPEPLDQCAEAAALETVVVGDFEQPAALGWSSNTDFLSSTSTPAVPPQTGSDNPGLPTARFDTARCTTSASGIHVVLRNVIDGGYSVQVNTITNAIPNSGTAAYFDATAYEGLSFWGRIGSDSNSTFFASVKERSTLPGTSVLFTPAERGELLPTGNYCEFNAVDVDGNPGTDPTLSQCDAFGKGIGLAEEWRFFKVPFAVMRQRAYGRAAQQPTPDQRIFGLEFRVEGGPNWDFWLDDVAFYKEPPAQ